MQIPTVPTFVAEDISVTKLQQLSNCVAFLTCANQFPIWHIYKPPSNTQTVTSGVATVVTYSATAIDTDRVSNGSGTITINTQGYYACEACVPMQTQTGAFAVQLCFTWTAGPGNPHYNSGTTKIFGPRSGWTIAAGAQDETICIDDLCPVVCYPADTIAVTITANGSPSTIDSNNVNGAVQGRMACNFTGRFVRTGS